MLFLYYFTYIFYFRKKLVSWNSNKTKGKQEVCKEETCGDETFGEICEIINYNFTG